jgi:hypothetical protein
MRDMGNIRPQQLHEIESLVWTMVLKIARGETQAPDALKELMNSIPWDIVESWGPDDPNWSWFHGVVPTTFIINSGHLPAQVFVSCLVLYDMR